MLSAAVSIGAICALLVGCGCGRVAPFDDAAIDGPVEIPPSDANAASDGRGVPQDAIGGPPRLELPSECGVALHPLRDLSGSDGTLPAPGPFRPCRGLGDQHFDDVTFSADGTRIAVLGAGGQVQVLATDTLHPLRTVARRRGEYSAFALSPDGRLVATSAELDGELNVWRVDDGALLRVWDLGAPPRAYEGGAVTFSPDGGLVAAAVESQTFVLDLASGAVRQLDEASLHTTDLTFTPDGRWLVSARHSHFQMGFSNGYVAVWELTSGAFKELAPSRDIYGAPAVLVSRAGILTAHLDQLALWDPESGAQRWSTTATFEPPVGISDDGSEIAVLDGTTFRRLRLSDFGLVDELALRFADPGATVVRARWSAASNRLAVADWRRLGVIDVAGRQVVAQACGERPVASSMAFSRDGGFVWGGDRENGASRFSVMSGAPDGPKLRIEAGLYPAPDGRRAYRTWLDGTTQVLDVEAGTTLPLSMPSSPEWVGWFSPDSMLLAVSSWRGTLLRVFDAETGARIISATVPQNGSPLGFDESGRHARLQHGSELVTMVDTQDGSVVEHRLPGSAYAMSPDGRVLTVNQASGRATANIHGPDSTLLTSIPIPPRDCFAETPRATMSPDGGLVTVSVSCSRDYNEIVGPSTDIHDAHTGTLVQHLPGFVDPVFSWDDRMFVNRDLLWCRD